MMRDRASAVGEVIDHRVRWLGLGRSCFPLRGSGARDRSMAWRHLMLASSRVPSPTKPHRPVADGTPSHFPHDEERVGFFMVRLFTGERAGGTLA